MMQPNTEKLWTAQDRHQGDRKRLFTAVKTAVGGMETLYPGSFVDIAASFVFESVTYVDTDARASKFFADTVGVQHIIKSEEGSPSVSVRFLRADYQHDLEVRAGSCDLLISLYAGFVSEFCTKYLRIGGTLLAAPSHGDVAMASIDDRYELSGVVVSLSGGYEVKTDNLDTFLIPKSSIKLTAEMIRERGRGIAYTKSPFAYLFRRIS